MTDLLQEKKCFQEYQIGKSFPFLKIFKNCKKKIAILLDKLSRIENNSKISRYKLSRMSNFKFFAG